MLEKEQKLNYVEDIRKNFAEIENLDLAEFFENDRGEIFSKYYGSYQRSIQMAKAFVELKLEELPDDLVHHYWRQFLSLRKTVEDVRNYCLAIGEMGKKSEAAEQSILSEFERIPAELWQQLPLEFLRFRLSEKDFFVDLIAQVHDIKREARESLEEQVSNSKAGLKNIEEMYSKAVVHKHAGNFKESIERDESSSRKWLMAGIVAIVILIVFLEFFLPNSFESLRKEETSIIVQMLFSKLGLVSIVTYFIVFCFRQYSSRRHNITINQHRMNALGTFESFIAGTEDQRIKEVMLLEAAQAVFKPQSSGYLKTQNENPSSTVAELVKTTVASESNR